MGKIILKLTAGKIISIEKEDEPGVVYRGMVVDVKDNGYVKLVFQDRYELNDARERLLKYMKDNAISQTLLSSITGVSRVTISRYCKGKSSIPNRFLARLGIDHGLTEMEVLRRDEVIQDLKYKMKVVIDTLDLL